ncbi:hypothetical protein KBH77_04345 [Patescibacteria group bacterium]|nr:hypothetical protein [Patescibacteria group bacterium]HQL11582.1 hypothetical protein [bacterium]
MKPNQQVIQYKKNLNKQVKALIVLGLSIIICFFIYISQIAIISSKGFIITELEKKMSTLEDQNKVLTLELTNVKEISNLEEYSKEKKMVNIDKINYISLTSNVAMK